MSSRLTMMPPSQAATRNPPKRGARSTTRPATTSITPTMCMPAAALPGSRLLNSDERYFVQSSVRTFANLSRPNRIGATVKAIRSMRNACATGSRRSSSERGIGIGRSVAATVLIDCSSLRGREVSTVWRAPRARTYVGERKCLGSVGVGAGRSARAPRVVVAGGSIGGLTAAHVLAGAGCDVLVLERSPEPLTGRGAGIVLHPATVRWWRDHAVRPLDELGPRMTRLRYIDGDGAIAYEQPCRYRVSSFDALYRDLSGQLDDDRHRLGVAVAGFEMDEDGVTVALEGGGSERADLLVCADGIQSPARRRLLPDVDPRYAGYVAWRGTVVEHDLSEATLDALLGAITYHLMPHSHFLTYPIPGPDGSVDVGRRLTNWLWYRNVAAGAALDELMTDRAGVRRPVSLAPGAVASGPLDALRAAAALPPPPPLHELPAPTPEPFLQAVFDIDVPRMAFGHAGLIGDAAFALRPHAAVGSAKAAEDAWTLGAAMRAANFEVPDALRRWEPGQLALGRAALARTRRAVKHADGATGVWISLVDDGRMHFDVVDDGAG